MRWPALIAASALVAAVPLAIAPYWSTQTANVDTGPIADRIIAGAVIVATPANAERATESPGPGATEVRVDIAARDAARVTSGLAAELTTIGGHARIGHGVVSRVEPPATAPLDTTGDKEAIRLAWITWDGAPPPLPVDQAIEAVIELSARRAVRVPRRAVVIRDGRTVVDGRFGLWSREIPVEVGAADAIFAEVRGIGPGTPVYLHE
jgi:hypothetical protein